MELCGAVPAVVIQQVAAMGFSEALAEAALRQCRCNVQDAVNLLITNPPALPKSAPPAPATKRQRSAGSTAVPSSGSAASPPAESVGRYAAELVFGPAAFGPLRRANFKAPPESQQCCADVGAILRASVKGVERMRGERDRKTVIQMLSDCYRGGLFMMPALNSEIIPAIRFVFWRLSQNSPRNDLRVRYLTTLAEACQDCQQVQASVLGPSSIKEGLPDVPRSGGVG